MLEHESQLIEDLEHFLMDNSSYRAEEIKNIKDLIYKYVNLNKKFNEVNIYREIEKCVEGDHCSFNNSLFKVKNKYIDQKFISNVKNLERHPWIIKSVISRLKVFKRQRANMLEEQIDQRNSLNDLGLLVIPNFLQKSLYQNVVNEISNIPFSLNKDDSYTIRYSNRINKIFNYFPTKMHFSGLTLNHIASVMSVFGFENSFLECKKNVFSTSFWQKINIVCGDNDIQKDAHMDTFFPSLKFWYFPFDVSVNKAFMYAKGSHKMSYKRMKVEFEKLKKLIHVFRPELLNNRVSLDNPWGSNSLQSTLQGSLRFDQDDLNNIKCKLEPVAVKKNSLIIADVSGIHSRSLGDKNINNATRIGIHGNTRHLKIF